MEISEFTLKIIIILIPGAIASLVYERLTIHKKWTSFEFITMSILFGGISYLVAEALHNYIYFLNDDTLNDFWANLPTREIPFSAVISASIASLFVGLSATVIDHFKLVNKFGKLIRITNKYGDENLYSYFLNANSITEVYIRDKKNGLTYHGVIDSFSETDEFKEIVLSDVKVYGYEDSIFYYHIDKLYLARHQDDITMEVPFINQNSSDYNHGRQTKTNSRRMDKGEP
jgi:hypothetical protein